MAIGDKDDKMFEWHYVDHDDGPVVPRAGPVEPSSGVRSHTREGHLRRGKILRKSLEALDHLLSHDGTGTWGGGLSSIGRRAISVLAHGALYNWTWGYACIAEQHSRNAFTLSATFRYKLESWVVDGADSRVELQECLRQFIAALDSERAEVEG